MDESFDGPPFAGELVEKNDTIKGAFAKVKEFADDPRWIVKEVNNLDPDYYGTQTKVQINFETFRDQVGKSHDLLAKSGTHLKDFIPQNFLVYGKNEEGEEKGFIVMRKIEGTELIKINKLTTEQLRQLDDLINASLDFYLETRKDLHLGPGFDYEIGYLPDLVSTKIGEADVPNYLTNIMIGKEPGETEEKVYFTDTYPLGPIYGGAQDKYWQLLDETLKNTETKFGQDVFTKSREKLSQITSTKTNQIDPT